MGPLEDDSLSLFFLCILEDSKSPPNLESRCCIALIVIQVQYKLFPNNVVWLQALDTFNTAVVSPIYYAGFTSFTILASAIMFKDYSGQSASSIASELCGFLTVLSGTAVLHSTREPDPPTLPDLYTPLSPKVSWCIQGNGEHWKQKDEDGSPPDFITILRQDHFK
ncbi:hypothetical protein NC651_003088 [Populus alba x Populus x berolinensis]|nr:hypothetical protein NC651_003088 [Populus alba x Populus x berolinensis]